MRDVVILGSTGSIGTQALAVIRERPEQFRVTALTAGTRVRVVADQVAEFQPEVVAMSTDVAADALRAELRVRGVSVPLIYGLGGNEIAAALPTDVVLNAITGAAGLLPTLATLGAGTRLALANKESLVIGGRLVTDAAAPGQLVAVDSEHSAFAQALRTGRAEEVRRLILTASGGPFRGWSREQLTTVTPGQALAHPTWTMGRVITINSATLVNKGLELIEAALLYGIDYDAITVVVHPTSDVHSMVEFVDGSTIAQASPPDMRLPIALALGWPHRIPDAAPAYDWTQPRTWSFEPLDTASFGAVDLARRCGLAAGTAPAVYNAANEVCVDAFCAGALTFLDIVTTVEAVVVEHLAAGQVPDEALTVAAVLAADAWARQRTAELVGVAR
ncbi:MAG: 1-deoxy-D-xylulose-5-phosphate reductoisomerase [Propioniciclava sp.]